MMKKGQAAMEFLMTYGWAILVVLAAVGALAYFGVLDTSSLFPEKCDFGGQGLSCIDKPSMDDAADTITLALKNNLGEKVTITSVTATDDCASLDDWEVCDEIANCGSALNNATNVTNDQGFLLQLTCSTDGLEGKFKSDVTVTYTNTETGLPHAVTGQLRGKA